MNYITEINLFYDWIDSHRISSGGIVLWHTLVHIANKSGWSSQLNIPISVLEHKTRLSKSAIYRARIELKEEGIIDFSPRRGRHCALYILKSFETHILAFSENRNNTLGSFDSQNQTIFDTQSDKRVGFVSQKTSDSGNIYKLNNFFINKEKYKKEIEANEFASGESKEFKDFDFSNREVGAEAPHFLTDPQKKKERKSCAKKKEKRSLPLDEIEQWVISIPSPWKELIHSWLEYKLSRKEQYRSLMSVTKCLAQLQKLSANNPSIAQQIIDQSIANNWAGLFELKRQSYYTSRQNNYPATGQLVGQIIQPESEERKRQILENFGKTQ